MDQKGLIGAVGVGGGDSADLFKNAATGSRQLCERDRGQGDEVLASFAKPKSAPAAARSASGISPAVSPALIFTFRSRCFVCCGSVGKAER